MIDVVLSFDLSLLSVVLDLLLVNLSFGQYLAPSGSMRVLILFQVAGNMLLCLRRWFVENFLGIFFNWKDKEYWRKEVATCSWPTHLVIWRQIFERSIAYLCEIRRLVNDLSDVWNATSWLSIHNWKVTGHQAQTLGWVYCYISNPKNLIVLGWVRV